MRISLQWLKKYVDIKISAEELADRLTMQGFEVETIERPGEKYSNFIVGEVISVIKHSNADKLSVCKVQTGSEILQIVCGAPNVATGQKVPVGLSGAIVPKNQHDPNGKPFVLSHVKVRGEDSHGMICSPYELDLGDNKSGIMILDQKAMPGMPLADYFGLNDIIFEVGVTPNRPDALSHIGIAREVSALLDKRLKLPVIKVREGKKAIKSAIKIKIGDKIGCPRYSTRIVTDVTISDSPKWLKGKLEAIGIRPINNIVDVTNFVLMESGQPLHAFDYNKIRGQMIIVDTAQEGEKFTTLDGKERILKSDTLMIADGAGPIAVAGVMGGQNSEISSSTTNVLIESAYFQSKSIRKTSKYFGLSTDASQRFERGADPNGTIWAVNRAAEMIAELAGGTILKGIADVYPKPVHKKNILLSIERANTTLGTNISIAKVIALLAKIEIKATSKGSKSSDLLLCEVPTFRPDIEREIDLIEEVARLYGYNNIETKTHISLSINDTRQSFDLQNEIKNWLVGSGYNEIVSNSMADESIAKLASGNFVRIANPISKEMESLRTSLIPGTLRTIKENIFHGTKDLGIFEFGKVYFSNSGGEKENPLANFVEKSQLLISFSGNTKPGSWDDPPRKYDIFDVKGELQTLFKKIFLDKIKFIPYSTTNALTQMGLTIEIQGETIGSVGVIHKEMLQKYDIEQDVFCAELDLGLLTKVATREKKYSSLPKYPSVTRDVAFVVSKSVQAGDLHSAIKRSAGVLLSKVDLFDIYEGNQISSDKKSIAFALEFLSMEHTLTQTEIDNVMQSIINNVSNQFEATIRK